jgi:hypothetical protein
MDNLQKVLWSITATARSKYQQKETRIGGGGTSLIAFRKRNFWRVTKIIMKTIYEKSCFYPFYWNPSTIYWHDLVSYQNSRHVGFTMSCSLSFLEFSSGIWVRFCDVLTVVILKVRSINKAWHSRWVEKLIRFNIFSGTHPKVIHLDF